MRGGARLKSRPGPPPSLLRDSVGPPTTPRPRTHRNGETKAAGRRGSSEDDLPLPLNRAPDLGDGRGLNPSPDEHRPAANRSITTHSRLYNPASRTRLERRRCTADFVAGGLHRRASSRNESEG